MSTPVCHKFFPDWGYKLLVPLSFAAAEMDDILAQTNGCGREGVEGRIVPDTIRGLDVSPVCRVHDWMYIEAAERSRKHGNQDRVTQDEHYADGVFALNLVFTINDHSGSKFMRLLRLRRANKYINAVAVTDVLKVLPRETLVAMGYGSATEALGEMIC